MEIHTTPTIIHIHTITQAPTHTITLITIITITMAINEGNEAAGK